jgi:ribonucleoside-diphosphate reductase alpha chain
MKREREKLPDDREGVTHHFVIMSAHPDGGTYDVDGYITTGQYPDGRLGELFVKVGKSDGSHAMLDQWAISVSYALQYGAPLDGFLGKFVGARFEPSGATKNKEIPRCTSPVDYVARYLLLRYGTPEMLAVAEEEAAERENGYTNGGAA